MWPFKYPYTNFHELNLDWILRKMQEIPAMIKEEVSKIAVRYSADNYVPVTAFGAKGDGVTNDTEAFQAAINSGTNIFVPKGDYLLGNLTYPEKGFNWIIDSEVNFIGNEIPHYKGSTTYMAWNNPEEQIYIRNVNKVGLHSPLGAVRPTLHVRVDQEAEDDDSYRWGILSRVNAYNNANTNSQNVAIYGQTRAYGDGQSWAGCLEIRDEHGEAPTREKIGLEITCMGKGGDPNRQRIGLSIQNAEGGFDSAILIGASSNAKYENGIRFSGEGSLTFGINARGANFTGPVIEMKAGQSIRYGNYTTRAVTGEDCFEWNYQGTRLGSVGLDGFANRYLKIGNIESDVSGNYISVTRVSDGATFKLRLE